MSKFYKLSIINTGGEYCAGVVTDDDQKELLYQKIDEEDVNFNNDSDDDSTSVHSFEIDNLIHVYGPNINEAKITLDSYKDDECEEHISEIVDFDKDIEEYPLTIFLMENPYLSDDLKKELSSSEDDLFFAGLTVEKSLDVPFVVELQDDEEFKFENVYIGTILMDEAFQGLEDNVVSVGLYLTPENKKKILKKYNDPDQSLEYFEELLSEVYYSKDKKMLELLQEYEMSILDIEGQGFSKGETIIVQNMADDVLYETYY